MFKLYEDKKNNFDKLIVNYFTKGKFNDILNYSLEEGKRIRPIILLETFKMLGRKEDSLAENFAIALEMIHNYSLVHDDLPSMDNDNYRRGRETTHYKFGEDMAILAGDSLLNFAYELIFNQISLHPKKNVINAGKIISECSGINGMIKGQIIDIKNDLDSKEKIIDMYLNKTCKLFIAATTAAAYLADASEDTINDMYDLGFSIGIAFQLQDDLLDEEQDDKIDKITYLSLAGREKTIEDIKHYTDKAISILNKYDDNDFLQSLLNYLVDRTV